MTPEDRLRAYEDAFRELGGDEILGTAQVDYLVEAITGARTAAGLIRDVDLGELAWGFESAGIKAYRDGVAERTLRDAFERAFYVRGALWASGQGEKLHDLWMLTVSGVLAQRQPELRRLLSELDWSEAFGAAPESWDSRIQWEAVRALLHLARKSGAWSDIDTALDALRSLAELQRQFEGAFLDEVQDPADGSVERRRLLGLYHVAEALGVLGSYLRTGEPQSVLPTLERHSEHARFALSNIDDLDLAQVGETIGLVVAEMVRASIWHNTSRLSEAAREFGRHLTTRDSGPVLELWWAQREALASNLLDPFKIAVSVQLPTSAGKTLLAEFAIVQALALNPTGVVGYIVPTRALVNQITRRLRADLEGATIAGRSPRVEAAVPVFEIDPTEESLLSERPDVLVTTPEKLDLLVRSSHPAVETLVLVVADEAHLISEPSRGPRLELLLATLKRERGPTCHFLLLTPFLPNARELAEWLGDEDHVAISVDWRPSEQIRAVGRWRRSKGRYFDTLTLVPSVTQPNSWESVQIELGPANAERPTRSRPWISASIAVSLSRESKGGTLILTRGPGTAEARADQVASMLGPVQWSDADETSKLLSAGIEYIQSELGAEYPLSRTLQNGVAFHHAGLPPEVRALVEVLLETGSVQVVAGTTTLAQGVNFPLATVIVETLTIPQGRGQPHRPLLYSEFWNVAGRAGRALKDRVGLVVWPATSAAEERTFSDYLSGEAATVASALLEVVTSLNDETEYNLSLVRSLPALSHFLQYLAHALRVGGFERASAEVEEILRSSLVFHRLRQDDYEAAERLVRWSRRFLEATRDQPLLDVADVTGLSLPSVGLLAGTAPDFVRDREFWKPDNLFGPELGPLTELVRLLADLPEMSLGSDVAGGLNAERVAGVIHDWVNGATLPQIASNWYPSGDRKQALREAGRYLFRDLTGQVPWGLGALQLLTLSGDVADEELIEARRVPAMTFYGVRDPQALAMRMVGVPRAAAGEIGAGAPAFRSFEAAREWVSSRPQDIWDRAGTARGISGDAIRRVWAAVGGSSA